MCSEKPLIMCSTPSLKSLPNGAFETVPTFIWLTMAFSLILSRKIVWHFLFLHLFPPGDRWCDVLGFVPTGSVSVSSTLLTFQEAIHLWRLLCPPVCLLGHFPSFWRVQGSTPTGAFEDGCWPLTHCTLIWITDIIIPTYTWFLTKEGNPAWVGERCFDERQQTHHTDEYETWNHKTNRHMTLMNMKPEITRPADTWHWWTWNPKSSQDQQTHDTDEHETWNHHKTSRHMTLMNMKPKIITRPTDTWHWWTWNLKSPQDQQTHDTDEHETWNHNTTE